MVKFPDHRHVLSFDERDHIIREWCDGQYPSVSLAWWSFSLLLLLSSWLIHVPMTMRLCNPRIPEEHFVCYQTSQRNWVIIKELYRCLQRYMLGWRISRLRFVTPIVGEVSLGPLGNAHHLSLASTATNELVAGWYITERVKRLAGNEIELGIEIPTIKSRASNIPMTKGTTYVVMRSDR
jgi:hypothetical protein